MPIVTTIDTDAKLVHHRVEGVLTLKDSLEAIDRLFNNPEFRPEMDILLEISPGATSGLTSMEVVKVLEALRHVGERRGTGRSVAVAPYDADFGLVRVLTERLEDGTRATRVFKSLEQAKAWLAAE
jgi:hypothetical protein